MIDKDMRSTITQIVQEQLAMRGQFIEGLLVKAVAEHGVENIKIVEQQHADGTLSWSVAKKDVAATPAPAPTPTLVEPHDFIGDMNAVFIANPVIMSMLSPEVQSAVLQSFTKESRLAPKRDAVIEAAEKTHLAACDCRMCEALRALQDEEAK